VRMDQKSKPATENGHVYRQRFSVPFEYVVCFTKGVFAADNPLLARVLSGQEPGRRHRVLCILDHGVHAAWPQLDQAICAYFQAHSHALDLVAPPLVVTGGELAKQSTEVVDRVHAAIRRHGIDRHSFVLGVGGGAMLDAVGYAAATAHRGVRLLRVPTTVLAQNDSGVGVKSGINALGTKNFLGSFDPPYAVINDRDFLQTLAPRDLRAGLAEAVKVALIRDASFFEWLEAQRDELARFTPQAMATMIRRAAEIHMAHIAGSGDPFERGSARPLDFGHWAAHKLEALSDHDLRHGEAVAIGIALDCRYAADAGLLSQDAQLRVCDLLEDLGFRLWHPALTEVEADGRRALLSGLEEFREHLGGVLTVTLLSEIGRGVEVHTIDPDGVLRAIDWLEGRDAERDAAQ